MRHLYDIPRQSSAAGGQKSTAMSGAAKSRRVQDTSKPSVEDVREKPVVDETVGYPVPNPYYPETRHRLPESERSYSNYRYFDGRPGRYGYGNHDYEYGSNGYEGDVYRFGFNRGYDVARFDNESNERTEVVLKHFTGHLSRALTLFNQGRYREAADAFRLAAEEHQGDPSSRLYAAHALFAIGRYHEAVGFVRRAFELQSRIVYLTFDMRDDYGQRRDFTQQLGALESAVHSSPSNADRLLMLGYVRYFTGDRDGAYESLLAAYKLNHRDPLVKQLLENSRPADVTMDARTK